VIWLGGYRVAEGTMPLGQLYIRNYVNPHAPDEVVYTPFSPGDEPDPPASLMRFESPVSFNAIEMSFEDQIAGLESALGEEQVFEVIQAVKATMGGSSALMVTGFGSGIQNSMLRETRVQFGQYRVGEGTRPYGKLYVRNYVSGDDVIIYTPAGTCVPSQTDCSTPGDPVCGCDGVTYENDCMRIQARVALDHVGSCL
jgi:hypothetical protein